MPDVGRHLEDPEQSDVLFEAPLIDDGAQRVARPISPKWNTTTKLIIGLTLMAMGIYLFGRFLNIVTPIMLAFLLAYLIYPLITPVYRSLHISWRFATTIIYLLVVFVLIGAGTWGGIAVVEQIQSLIGFLQKAVSGLPDFINNIAAQPIQIGPFSFKPDPLNMDLNAITQDLLGAIQPMLSGAGSLVGTFASSAANFIGWTFFVLLLSYFIVGESGGAPNQLVDLQIPGHAEDLNRLGAELNRIWNAFLRGQLIIVLLTIIVYTFLLGVLGLKFFFGLAFLAGLARFVPYVGPGIAWTSYGLVAYFQGSTLFGIPPLVYVGIVVGIAWLTDMVLDNFVVPRIMSSALRVHPAAVMVSAIVALNLLGVVGVILAAPVLATIKLVLDYTFNKLFDLDPWARMETMPPPAAVPKLLPTIHQYYDTVRRRIGQLVGLRR